jgi:hypothetical protein
VSNAPKGGNGIAVNAKLVADLRTAVKKDGRAIDKLASDRELIEGVVAQMYPILGPNPVYCKGGRPEQYQWFDTEHSRKIQAREDLADKGRFVDACIIAWLWGKPGIQKFCISSRVLRPRQLTPQEMAVISQTSAEIAAAKDEDKPHVPVTPPEEFGHLDDSK